MNFQLSNTFSTTCTLENLESLFDDPMLDDTSAEDDLLWNNREITLSPPTVIIPSSSSTSNNTNTTSSMSNVYSDDRSFAVGRPALMINLPANSSSGAAFSYTTRSVDDDVHIHNNNNNYQQQAIVAPPQAPGSPRTPRLALDIKEVLQSWNAITSNNNVNTPIDIEHHVKELLDQLQNSNTNTTTTPCNNNNNNLNIMNNMMNNNTTFINNNNHQDYLGSIIASGTPFHSPMRARPQYHHTKSPSLGSTTQSRGIKKGTRERSNSCFQSIQSYSNSKMQSFGNSSSVPNNNNNMLMMNSSMMNMNGGLNSPSVTSTCSSNVTVSPANVSTNSFGIMMNNGPQGYMSNNNSQVIVNNNQQVTMANSSSKKGKIPANRQDKNNQSHLAYQQHSKGLLVEATPNDKPIKMQQCKLVDGGIRIQIEDGISKNRKDTGLQFHTCTFK